MKKMIPALLLLFSYCTNAQTAKIKIDIDRTIGEIDPKIYGVFMEPITFSGRRFGLPDSVKFNTMYGTLYDPSSPLADENGFKKNYLEAMRELKVTNMRWPGGNYVAGYSWQDGIGPKAQRPVRKDLAWGGIDNNHVGVNRHQDKPIIAEITNSSGDLAGKAETSLLNNDKLRDAFIFDQQAQYSPLKKEIETRNNKFSCTFPPHSFTQIKVGIIKK